MNAEPAIVPDVDTLAALFFADRAALGRFEEVAPADMPPVYRKLLDHEHHMTVTVEEHHGGPVDVKVLRRRIAPPRAPHTSNGKAAPSTSDAPTPEPTHYAREILLIRQRDGAVVQYGIMRVNFAFLGQAVRREIESERTPLGRVLIEHDVLRRIHLFSLWRITPGDRLAEALQIDPVRDAFTPIYGRTALIYCNDEPAIELLEIVKQ